MTDHQASGITTSEEDFHTTNWKTHKPRLCKHFGIDFQHEYKGFAQARTTFPKGPVEILGKTQESPAVVRLDV